ncbi:MAG TPA: menaquinone biosynthesis protein [Tepidisphaeraceae bacterium]|jgi:chorismate dehydratase
MHRIAAVSFLNSKPLIEGLERRADVQLMLEVPSRLHETLRNGSADVALLPVIDYQRLEGLTLLPAGGIVSDGETLTVRVFSRVPIQQITSLACDWHSHTSVALARIILSRQYNLHPEMVDIRSAAHDPQQARLLIGDKVVCEEPQGFPYQLDLGREWKTMTGLPFVFAAWMGRDGEDYTALAQVLRAAKESGMKNIDGIIKKFAVPLGWPVQLAWQYLTQNLTFDIRSHELQAIRLFHQVAAEEGIIANPPRALKVFE